MIAQHQSITDEHHTPSEIIEAGRKVLNHFDLDPASCAKANRIVQAEKYFTRRTDGLKQQWHGRVFLNPPGGKFALKTELAKSLTKDQQKEIRAKHREEAETWGTRSRALAWWKKLMKEHRAGRTTHALFLGFTLEILRSSQECLEGSALDFPICVPRDRLEFSGAEDPTHGNVIVYIGPDADRFAKVFSQFGRCR